MNSKTYLQNIATEFGGFRREELVEKLEKLLKLKGAEDFNDYLIFTKKTYHTKKPEPFIPPPEHIAITNYEAMPTNNYDKAMKLIRDCNGKGWKHITEVPVEVFNDFMAIADLHSEIEFDFEREYQWFKVDGFKAI